MVPFTLYEWFGDEITGGDTSRVIFLSFNE